MQKIRIELGSSDLLSYLDEIGYPHTAWIEDKWMIGECIIARVSDQYGTVGFIWAHWVSPGVMTAHVATMHGAKIQWHQLMDDLDTITYFFGADEVVLSFDHTPRARVLGRLVERLGFVRDEDNEFSVSTLYRRPTHELPHAKEATAALEVLP